MADRVHVLVNFFDQAAALQIVNQLFAAVEAIQPLVGASLGIHNAVIVHHIDRRQLVTQPNLKVVRIVRRSHFHATGSKFGIDIFVSHNRNLAVQYRKNQRLADQIGIALVARAHGHGHITEHRFRAGRRHNNLPFFILHCIADVNHHAFSFDMLALFIGQRGGAARAPVNDAVSTVDQIFFIEAAEDFENRFAQPLIHCETLAVPVARRTQLFKLIDNGAAVFLFPVPDFFQEGFAFEIVATLALFGQLALHHVLGGDSGVVGARHPQCILALHAPPTNQHILNGIVERMTHVQDSGHIRRRNHNSRGFLGIRRLRGERLLLQPFGIPLFLNILRIVVLR